MIQPVQEILPNTSKELQPILAKFSMLLNESVNYGTHLLKWDIEMEREGKDNHIPSVFLRNIIELADAISILINNSSIDPAKIIFRSLIESCYGLIYMIEKNQKQRANCFLVIKSVEKIKQCNKWISSENSHKEFVSKINQDDLEVDLSKYFDHAEFVNVKEQREKLLNKQEFKSVHDEYIRTKKKLNKDPNWYSLYDGPRNFRELTEQIGKALRYEFYYRTFSDNVHGTSVEKGFAYAGEDRAQVIQIRDFENVEELFSHTVATLLELYIFFIRYRIPEKEECFKDWFKKFKIPYFEITKAKLINYKK